MLMMEAHISYIVLNGKVNYNLTLKREVSLFSFDFFYSIIYLLKRYEGWIVMTGKVLKISSNDLYGNVDDRMVRVYAVFEHTKYMNNYVIFSIDGSNKLCFGSIHMKDTSLVISGTGEVMEPDDGIIGIGSGGNYAMSAAKALYDIDGLSLKDIAQKAMKIAGDIDIYTNHNVIMESIEND